MSDASSGDDLRVVSRPSAPPPSPWLSAVLGAIGSAVLIGGMLVAFGQDRGTTTTALRQLSEQVAEMRSVIAGVPAMAATVQRLDSLAGQAGQAREAAREYTDRLAAEVRNLERQFGEMKGRQDAVGTALVTLHGTSTAVAGLRADVDASRRETESRDRVQDDRMRSLADIVTGVRDALIARGVAPAPRRQNELTPPPGGPSNELRIAGLPGPVLPADWIAVPGLGRRPRRG